ncbi:MAG: acetolactate synthase [Angelakisella sp.]|jgi:hypothetical protein|nr:acetolactate synthase [Angelakisella sp.]
MTIKQLSVFVENKQGRLSEITGILQGAGVDIRALSLADTTDFGILRLIVDKEEAAEAALRGAGFTVSLTPVIAAGIADRPGGLAEAMALLRDGGISVEYMYAFISRRKEMAYVILRVDDNGKAAELLQKAAFPLLTEEEIAE